MFGSLYGDLPDAKDSGAAAKSQSTSGSGSGWSVPQLRVPAKRTAPAMPPSVLRAGRGRGASSGRGDGSGGRSGGANPAAELAAASFLSVDGKPLRDEYDPARPNDYAAIRRQREEARKEAEREAERQEAMRRAEAAAAALAAARPNEARDAPSDAARDSNGAAPAQEFPGGPAVPVAAASGEEAYLRRARLGKGGAAAQQDDQGGAGGDARGMGLAAKMMEKMGWRGGGLGREQQGMAAPLVAQKRDGRHGIITHADADQKPKGTVIQGKPSKVVLLRNMVGPGQVDDTLEEEVGLECTGKYGAVTGVVIFEVTEPGFPEDQAVRIFVAFERQEAAIKAAVDLGGRFFGGRQVRATFYSEERFNANDFAPDPLQES